PDRGVSGTRRHRLGGRRSDDRAPRLTRLSPDASSPGAGDQRARTVRSSPADVGRGRSERHGSGARGRVGRETVRRLAAWPLRPLTGRAQPLDLRRLLDDGRSMSFVRVEKPRPHVSLVLLDRPERLNAMSFDTVVPLYEAIQVVGRDNDTWVVVLSGAGRGFCSGLDLEDHGMPPGCDGLPMSRIAIRAMEL